MAVVNLINIIDLMKTLYKNHPHTFSLVYRFLSHFQLIVVLFALFYFGAAIFMTVWLRLKATDTAYLAGQGSQDMRIFNMWIGDQRILKKGLTVILAFTCFAVAVLPVMEQVRSL